jgi:hypothetical protein
MMTTTAAASRTVRCLDVQANDSARVANAIEDMYNDTLDVLVVRGAFAGERLATAARDLDRDDSSRPWSRPNEKMPVEDIHILGSDTPATPTYSAPRGASFDAYLAAAERHAEETRSVFDEGFDAAAEFRRVLGGFAGGRPVEVPSAPDGRAYTPFTIRRLVEGKQIGAHHDYHYPLDLYKELVPRVDTRTLVSFVTTLQRPDAGGELVVYAVTPQTPDAPKLPNGFSWDVPAIEERFDSVRIDTNPGDLFLLASGRCLHRVNKVAGPHARVTMGGFLALDKDNRRVYCWS